MLISKDKNNIVSMVSKPSADIRFVFARPCIENITTILAWKNDPSIMEYSFYQRERLLDEYSAYYKDFYKLAPIKPRFACVDEEYVGYVSYKRYHDPNISQGRQVEISVCSSPLYRKKGYNPYILVKASEIAVGLGFDAIIACVKEENHTSIMDYEKSGFHILDKNVMTINTGTRQEIIPVLRFIRA
jgi:RimJ/RimL family protein N-acetyltransferase